MFHRKFPSPLRRIVVVALAAGTFFGNLSAAPVDYLVDGWDTEKDLPSSTVTSIAQTPDGYLWAGTYNGLARFDGARFVTFDPVNTPAITQSRVQALFLDATGTLWINTFRGGLTTYRNGVFRNEWPDQSRFDLHTTLAVSSSNLVIFVTQFGEVLQRNPADTNAPWQTNLSSSAPVFQCADADNCLWFLTRDSHILQFRAGEFKELPGDGGLGNSHVNTLVADARGRVWAGAENEIALWDGKQFQAMTPTNSEGDIQPLLLFPTKSGALWVLDGDRFREMKGRAWVAEATQWRGLLGWASNRAMGAHEDRDGGLWFNHYGNGLFHITPDGRFQRVTSAEGLPGDRVGAWFQDNEGGIWSGVDHGGLARLRERQFHVIGATEGLARTALSVCTESNGAVLIGTAGGGLCRLENGRITRFAVGMSASANFVFSVFPRPNGEAWLSASEGEDLYQFRDGTVQRASWELHGIKSILTDHAGRTWIGTKAGIALWDHNERRIFGATNNLSLSSVRALVEAPDGTVWAGNDDGAIIRCDPDGLQIFRPKDALAEQPIYSMTADASGTIWAGTFRGGLLRFSGGRFSRITAKQGLSVDVVCQILDDGHGRLWLGTHQGIYCVAKSALNAVADGRANSLDYVAYGRHDGMASVECSDGYQPACWRGADGKLWFTTVRGGVVWVNADEVTAKSKPPPVLIEEMRVDGEPVALSAKSKIQSAKLKKDLEGALDYGSVVVPPGRKQLDFRFTALSFDGGDRARFRYRLDGQDNDWLDLDTRRTLQFRNLLPGEYRLRIIACNNEGVWNETGAIMAFEIRPRFYQTFWFRFVIGVGIIAGVSIAARRAATRKYRRRVAQLEQQHAIERDRARIAKDIHDDIGAGLTQITLLTELARREPEQTAPNLDRISDSARRLTKAMDEIVWAVDPQHDTLNGLLDYISAYAEDYLRTAGIRCRMDLPVTLPDARVEAESRYNLFLALKEALNNVVKHAKATEVWLRLHIEPKTFTLIVEDNGQGISADGSGDSAPRGARISSGSGLGNLDKRLAAIGGRCEIESRSGQGTRVALTVRLELVSPVMAIGRDEYVD